MFCPRKKSSSKSTAAATATATDSDNGNSPTDLKAFIETEVGQHQVVIFAKSYCPYCHRTEDLFEQKPELKDADIVIHHLDERQDGPELQDQLHTMTGQRTVPNVWINGSFLGGNDDTQRAYSNGKLQGMLSKM
uniref:Glutaredoxin domain-containing protein n=1 Tax=Craspedostauros australis TaxID=1486917 RepID=A0A7R9WUC6_9STRA|mmetsp:Transcript_18336/g.50899  ORF Transcript_18336/g.50899 Transcript_18336/m.50899 type:complete len:134 (+) Transcript_18336:95-496(+)|eukprot:CAMPEP_0198123712 /NCGR_PEP_ID=MMETSP1442-20131203/38170_1 /TAXON_ID= /ORGANISM="Craspedostauros australis, Strain CCMP3328" /LENGTH=133 /DNA_ID=CAMNT_0043782957 /DNA_START=90 /DNA_END=491 /DNA_ORIENTATION=-